MPADKVPFIADKIGMVGRKEDVKKYGGGKPYSVNGSKEYLHYAIDKTLKEFDMQSPVDLLIMNRMDPTRPIEEVVRTVDKKKCRLGQYRVLSSISLLLGHESS